MLAIICVLGALISAAIAVGKNRNGVGWLIAGALLPLISVVILLSLDPIPVQEAKPQA